MRKSGYLKLKMLKYKAVYLFSMAYARIHSWRYRRKYYIGINHQKVDDPFLVHLPKTAGQSIVESLQIEYAAHFPANTFLSSSRASKILIITRDPVARLKSIYAYSLKANHRNNIFSPLYLLRYFNSFDELVNSAVFDAFSRHHYFFRPAGYFLNGIDLSDKRVILLDFDNLPDEFRRAFGVRLIKRNVSPKVESLNISEQGRRKIVLLYESDYCLMRAQDAKCSSHHVHT